MSSPNEIASFWLESVLTGSGLLRTSSDLSRVKVKRVEPKTGATRELIVNLFNIAAG